MKTKRLLRWEAYMRFTGDTWEELYGDRKQALAECKKGQTVYRVRIERIKEVKE